MDKKAIVSEIKALKQMILDLEQAVVNSESPIMTEENIRDLSFSIADTLLMRMHEFQMDYDLKFDRHKFVELESVLYNQRNVEDYIKNIISSWFEDNGWEVSQKS